MTIIISKNKALRYPWRAKIEGSPESWEVGKTELEAMGRLVFIHSDKLGIKLKK